MELVLAHEEERESRRDREGGGFSELWPLRGDMEQWSRSGFTVGRTGPTSVSTLREIGT
jgi:hypothetical protein